MICIPNDERGWHLNKVREAAQIRHFAVMMWCLCEAGYYTTGLSGLRSVCSTRFLKRNLNGSSTRSIQTGNTRIYGVYAFTMKASELDIRLRPTLNYNVGLVTYRLH